MDLALDLLERAQVGEDGLDLEEVAAAADLRALHDHPRFRELVAGSR